jgi:hypothetical protein
MGALTESYCDRCTRGGPPLRVSRGFYPWGGINSDSRKPVSGGMWVNMWFSDEGNSRGSGLSPYVNFRFSTRLAINVGANVSRDHNDAQWYGNFPDNGAVTHYSFAHLEQRTISMSTRVNYTVTPDLTVEFYGSPFVATGTYSDIREVSSTPNAARYRDRFVAYTPPANSQTEFTFAQLKTNAVMRWEYRPGSTLFLVWAHGRADNATVNEQRSWTRDYRELFHLHPNNTFLVKLAYWLNR